MGRPGVGLAGRLVGIPGRGAAGMLGVGGLVSRATMSGRGGTTGRAAGWPARFGLAGGRRGPPPPVGAATAGALGADGVPGRIAGRGVGILGTGAAGRGGPGIANVGLAVVGLGLATAGVPADGVATEVGAFGNSPSPGGNGWRGPDRICPGFGAGTGRAGMALPRDTGGADGTGTEAGCPPRARGGRKG
jgi:hypothetical protein